MNLVLIVAAACITLLHTAKARPGTGILKGEACQELKDKGVEPYGLNYAGDPRLQTAAYDITKYNLNAVNNNATEVVLQLLRCYEQDRSLIYMVHERDNFGNTALCMAAAFGSAATVRVLLAAGAYIEGPCQHQASPLLLAAGYNEYSVVKELLQAGANTTVVDDSAYNLINWATFNKNAPTERPDVLEYLLENDLF